MCFIQPMAIEHSFFFMRFVSLEYVIKLMRLRKVTVSQQELFVFFKEGLELFLDIDI